MRVLLINDALVRQTLADTLAAVAASAYVLGVLSAVHAALSKLLY